jgi:hypothetical protein
MQFVLCPQNKGVRVCGSAELFPQYCQVPNLSQDKHLKALTEEIHTKTTVAVKTTKGKALEALILQPPTLVEQRVTNI